ncbi:MAG: ELL-associated factor [Propionibacteriaceae bacterium]|nr:ELL-associated factor [Propionibacteriaceae bacterium]
MLLDIDVNWTYISILVTACAAAVICSFVLWKRNAQSFLQLHPDAVTIVIDQHPALRCPITVLTVNGRPVTLHNVGMGTAFYTLPGRNTIQAQYDAPHPGGLSKPATKPGESVKLTFDLEPKCQYTLSWDEKSEQFQLNRLSSSGVSAALIGSS